jgi:selenocysteine lyase/cysteine desulfurase
LKPLIYADYTASGRALTFIEDAIREKVLPFYANTHTETSFTGAQSTAYREQARGIIRHAVNASDDDQIIFCGPGATAAINKLIDIMGLREKGAANLDERPVVFIGPYEHHSNELPWRESCAEVVVIPLTPDGLLDCSKLEAELVRFASRRLKIGSFSAASNVTGVKTDTRRVARLLHAHGAVSLWDYAAAAPYVAIDMNPSDDSAAAKDAVFLSPHKLVGGPGTPGVLVVKRHLLTNAVPAMPGGGTVLYVNPTDHTFIADPQRREEGGTPAIVEAIRAGLVFKLQQDVGTATIEAKEKDFRTRALARWRDNPAIEVLGNTANDSLAIFSLRLTCDTITGRRDLHYGFVVALLNDLFGIQARGGCSCAGPYGHNLLNMDMRTSRAIEKEIKKGHMVLRPGWVRLNFNYFIDESTFAYLLSAIELIAEYGARLLPFYEFDSSSATWRYQGREMQLGTALCDFDFLTDISADAGGGKPAFEASRDLPRFLSLARDELTRERSDATRYSVSLPASVEALRWFALPQEITYAASTESRIAG